MLRVNLHTTLRVSEKRWHLNLIKSTLQKNISNNLRLILNSDLSLGEINQELIRNRM